MKLKYLIYILTALSFSTSCEKRHIDDMMPDPVLYLVKSGVVTTNEFYNIEDSYDYHVYAYCSGLEEVNTKCSIIYTPELIDEYNTAHGTTLQLLPQDCYTITCDKATIIGDKSRSAKFSIQFHNQALSQYFNNDFTNITNYVIPLELQNDGAVATASDRKTILITPQLKAGYVYVSDGGFKRVLRNEMNDDYEDYEMTIKTVFTNKWDINLTLESNAEALKKFNNVYKTLFSNIAPSESFEIIGEPTLAVGENEKTITLRIHKSKLPDEGVFVVPLVLTGTNMVNIDPTRIGTAIYIYQTGSFSSYSKIDYSKLTITANAFSWQNEKDYAPRFAFDGKYSYSSPHGWFGRWSTADATGVGVVGSYPNWWLSADFGQEITVCGAGRWPRQNSNSNDVRAYLFEASLDGINWYYIGENDFGTTWPIGVEQFTSFDDAITLRHIRITFTKFNRATNSCDVAELCLYKK